MIKFDATAAILYICSHLGFLKMLKVLEIASRSLKVSESTGFLFIFLNQNLLCGQQSCVFGSGPRLYRIVIEKKTVEVIFKKKLIIIFKY